MHPCLSVFPSNSFYDGELQNGVSANERQLLKVKLPFPRSDRPMFFYCVDGIEEVGSTGTSYLNREEAYATEKLLQACFGVVRPEQIGSLRHIMRNVATCLSTWQETGPCVLIYTMI